MAEINSATQISPFATIGGPTVERLAHNAAHTGMGMAVSVDVYRDSDAVSDNTAISSAITAAGVGGVIQFGWDEYIYDAQITPLAGQLFLFNHARLKRRAPFIATLTATASSGTATPVWSLSTLIDTQGNSLRVGQQLNIYKAGSVWSNAAASATPDTQFSHTEQNNFTIVSVDTANRQVRLTGNTQANTYAVGDFVVSNCRGIVNDTAAGIGIRDLEIDGGFADAGRADSEGHIYGQWIANTAIRLIGDRTNIEDVYLHDIIGEGIMCGGRGSNIKKISGINTGGNLFHLTDNIGTQTYAGGSFITDVYAKSNSVGISRSHQNGVVTISTPVPDFTLSNFKVDGTAADNTTSVTPSFIGAISHTTRNLRLHNIKCYNTGLGTSGARTKSVVDFAASWSPATNNCDGLEIKNFYAFDCGDFVINKTDANSTSGRFTNVDIDHVRISNATLRLNGIGFGSKINDLHVDNSMLLAGSTKSSYDIKVMDKCSLTNFTSDNGAQDQSYTTTITDTCTDFKIGGKNWQKGGKNGIQIGGNGVRSEIDGFEHFTGIVAGSSIRVNNAGWVIKNAHTENTITGSGTGSTVGLDVNAQCVAINPLCKMSGNTYTLSILVRGGVTGAEIYNAISTAAISDSGTSTIKANAQVTLIYAT